MAQSTDAGAASFVILLLGCVLLLGTLPLKQAAKPGKTPEKAPAKPATVWGDLADAA